MKFSRVWVAVCAVSCLYLSSAHAEDAKEKPAFCKLYPQEGECGQFHLRWYYNEKRNECYQFMYRGCKGNENNFRDKNECMNTCGNGVPGEKTESTEPEAEVVEKTEETVKEKSEKKTSSHSAAEKKTTVEGRDVLATSSSKEEVKEDSKETAPEDPVEEPVFGDEDGEEDEEEDPDVILEDVFSKGILSKDSISPEDMGTLKQLVSDMTVYGMKEVPSNEADEDNREAETSKEETQDTGDLREDQGADQQEEGLESDETGDEGVLSTSSSKEEVKENSKETAPEDPVEEPVFGDEDGEEDEEEEEKEEDNNDEEDPDVILEDVFSKGILNKDSISPEDMGTLKQLVSDLTVYGMKEVPSNEADEDNREAETSKEETQDTGDLREDQGADQQEEGLESDVTGDEHLTDNNPMALPAIQEQHLDGDHAGDLVPGEDAAMEEMYLDENDEEDDDVDDEFDDDDEDDDDEDDDEDDDDDDDITDPLELLDEAQDLGVFDQNAMSDEDRNTLVNVMLKGTTYLTRDGHIVKSSHPWLPQAENADDDDNEQTEVSTKEDVAMEDSPEVPSETEQQTSLELQVPEIEEEEEDDNQETEEGEGKEEEVDNIDEILESAEKRGVFDGRVMSPDDKDTLTNLMSRLSVYELMPEDEQEEQEAEGIEENSEEQAEDGSINGQEEGDEAMGDADYFDEDESENGAGLLEMDPFGSVLDSEEPQFVTTPPPIYEKDDGKAKQLSGQPVPPMCFFKADSGPCKAKRRQWFYDFGRKKCMPFYYGGCLGNGNRFRSEAHCMSKCMGGIKLPVVQQPPMKLGPTMKVLEKFGPFKKIPTFMSLLAKPLMKRGKVRITLPSSGQPKPEVARQGSPISIMKPDTRQFPHVPSMPRIVPVPRTQQPNSQRPRLPMQRRVNTPFVPPPPPPASINIPMMTPKVGPPMNEAVRKPIMANSLMEKYPMLKVMFFKKHSPKQYVSPTVSKSNTLMSRHQDNRYQMHSSPKNGLSLTQIFVNKPALSAQANPTDFTFKHKGPMDRKGWKRRGGWDEAEEERDGRRWRRGRNERRMRDEWDNREPRMKDEWDNREPANQEIHHYHHYPQPAPLPVHKPPVMFFPPPPPQRPPMAWHPPIRPILPLPPRGHGQFLLQLLTKKRLPFEHRSTMEVSTANPDQQWQEEPAEYWDDDETDITEDPVDREPSYVCLLPVDSGRCKALDKKWYFNKDKGACETFFYGGCGGNANNFDTPEECRDACLDADYGENTTQYPEGVIVVTTAEYTRPDETDQEEVIEVIENEEEGEKDEEEGQQQQQDTPKEEEEQAIFDNGQIETSTIMVQEDLLDQEGAATKEPTKLMDSPAIAETDKEDSKDHTVQLEGGPHYILLLVIVCVVGLLLLLLIGVAIVHVLRKSRDVKKEKVIEAVVKSNLYSDLPKFVYAPPPPTPPTPTKESA